MFATLFGSLLGFVTAFAPELLKFFNQGREQLHERELFRLQLEQQQLGHQQRVEEIRIQADADQQIQVYKHAMMPSGYKWMEAFGSSVRPMITYCFFGLYASVKVGQYLLMGQVTDEGAIQTIALVWNTEDQAIFASIISFWFGSRAMSRTMGR